MNIHKLSLALMAILLISPLSAAAAASAPEKGRLSGARALYEKNDKGAKTTGALLHFEPGMAPTADGRAVPVFSGYYDKNLIPDKYSVNIKIDIYIYKYTDIASPPEQILAAEILTNLGEATIEGDSQERAFFEYMYDDVRSYLRNFDDSFNAILSGKFSVRAQLIDRVSGEIIGTAGDPDMPHAGSNPNYADYHFIPSYLDYNFEPEAESSRAQSPIRIPLHALLDVFYMPPTAMKKLEAAGITTDNIRDLRYVYKETKEVTQLLNSLGIDYSLKTYGRSSAEQEMPSLTRDAPQGPLCALVVSRYDRIHNFGGTLYRYNIHGKIDDMGFVLGEYYGNTIAGTIPYSSEDDSCFREKQDPPEPPKPPVSAPSAEVIKADIIKAIQEGLGKGKYTLYDMNGRKMQSGDAARPAGLDLDTFKPGAYVIENNGQVQKFVIVR